MPRNRFVVAIISGIKTAAHKNDVGMTADQTANFPEPHCGQTFNGSSVIL